MCLQSEARLRDVDMALRDNTLVINCSLKQIDASVQLESSMQSKLDAMRSSQLLQIEKNNASHSSHANSHTASANLSSS